MDNHIYGYCRVSTPKQSIERQIKNIKEKYPNAVIITEKYTGRTMDRPKWAALEKILKNGDTVVFDEVSRMARNAEEGFETYRFLYEKNITLIFLKEPHINTSVYKATLDTSIPLTGTDVDVILSAINEYLMILASNQIQIAFERSQQEVDHLSNRTKEGLAIAKLEGKRIGLPKGSKIETKKSKNAKAIIKRHSKDLNGSLEDKDVIKLAGISRNSYYKYKREIINSSK